MGNVDSRSKYEHGYMMVQTTQPIFNPGSTVSGSIYMRVGPGPCPSKDVLLEVKGVEKVSWIERVSRQVNGRTEWRNEKRKGKKEILHYKAPCFTFSVPTLMPGDYTIPFQFQLPQGIPSSIMFQGTGQKHPKAKVKYCIKATLQD